MQVRPYGVAALVTAAAVLIRYALEPWLGNDVPFITFFAVTAAVVWFAGVGPAVFSVLLAILVVNLPFLPPRLPVELPIGSRLEVQLAFLLASALIIGLGGVARRRDAGRLKALRDLRESELRFRHIADNAPVPLWMSGPSKEGIYFNQSWLEFTGRSIDQELGSGWTQGIHPDDIGRLEARDRAFDERRPFETRFRLRGADGEYRWLRDKAVPRFDSSGEFLGFIGVCVDVTDRSIAEESKALLAAIVDASDDAIVSKTLEGRILSWNPGAERLFGYSAEEALGESINLIVPVHLRDEEQEMLKQLRRGERIDHFETTRLRKDGRHVTISVTISPVFDSFGNVIGASHVSRDVTEQKKAEQELRASEQRYRALVESQAEMLCRFRLDGTILFVNQAYARALDTQPQSLVGRSFWDLIPAEEHAPIRAVLEYLTPASPEGRLENRFETAAGTRWTMWTNRALTFDSDGRPVEFQSTGIDISERKAAEEALRRADQRKNEFLAVLGHELRNPLAPLRAGMDLLQRLDGDEDAAKRTLEMMRRQLDHLVYLVDDLLDLARISRGLIELKRRSIDLRDPVDDAIALSRPVIDDGKQRLVFRRPPQPIPVNGDKERLAQVVGNLLNNAAKYSDPGGTIWLSLGIEGDVAVIRVRDTGFGIPAGQLEEIFEIFNQVSDHHPKHGGTGLGIGLSIARELISAHDGSIEARSAGLGRGSEFMVRLPLSAAAIVAKTRQPPVEKAHGSRRVLVVDDNEAAAESLRLLLERHGHLVATANDGFAALESVDAFKPEVVVLDIGLPNMNGYEVARRIRAMPGGADKLLLAVTGWGQNADKRLALDAGFDRHLTKPVDSTYLTHLIGGSGSSPSEICQSRGCPPAQA